MVLLETRKTAKGVIMVKRISDLKKNMKQLLPESSSESEDEEDNKSNEESSSDEEIECKRAKKEYNSS